MAATLHSKLRKRFYEEAKKFNYTCISIENSVNIGLPDVYLHNSTKAAWVEIKVHPDKPSEVQKYRLAQLPNAYIVVQTKEGKYALKTCTREVEGELNVVTLELFDTLQQLVTCLLTEL